MAAIRRGGAAPTGKRRQSLTARTAGTPRRDNRSDQLLSLHPDCDGADATHPNGGVRGGTRRLLPVAS